MTSVEGGMGVWGYGGVGVLGQNLDSSNLSTCCATLAYSTGSVLHAQIPRTPRAGARRVLGRTGATSEESGVR